MAWRDRIRGPATFRGAAFFVDVADRAGGRRVVQHEYPLRDVGFSEDMGRRARGFAIEGYVLGADYLAGRDALLDALEQAGPGELVHPYYGTRLVQVFAFRVRESTEEGGIARFQIDFLETEASPPAPTAVPAAPALVNASAEATVAALRARAAARGAVSLPALAFASAEAAISDAATAMGAKLAPIVSTANELAELKLRLDLIIVDAANLARMPADAVNAFIDALAIVATPSIAATAAVEALVAAYGFVPSCARPPATTSTRVAEQDLFDLLLHLIRTAEAVRAAQLALEATFASYDEAVAIRDAILACLDEQAELADDETFAALVQLRADLVRAVPGEGSDLPRLAAYAPPLTVPSLVLAHQLYGDLEREEDLVARNRVVRPGFVPGGVALEVLSGGRS